MRCIHIYRGAPQLGGIKLHKHFSWFHTAKWGVHIAPRTVLHVIRIVLTMELQPLKTVELHGWVCLPDSLVRNGSISPIHTDYKRTHTHTHTHTHTLTCIAPALFLHSLQWIQKLCVKFSSSLSIIHSLPNVSNMINNTCMWQCVTACIVCMHMFCAWSLLLKN